MHCTGEGYHANTLPADPFGFPIRWDLNFALTFGHNRVHVEIDGCTTKFPAFEIYGNRAVLLNTLDSGNVLNLTSGCQQPVHIITNVTAR